MSGKCCGVVVGGSVVVWVEGCECFLGDGIRGLVMVEGGVFLVGSLEVGVVFVSVMPCSKWLMAFCWVDEATE